MIKAKYPSKIISICLLLIITGIATANLETSKINAAEQRVLTLEQALEMAVNYDSQVITARNNVETAKLAVKQEVLKTWPQATVTDSLGDILDNPINPDTGKPYFTQFPNMLTITITQVIPTKLNLYGKKVPTAIETAIWERVSNEAQLEISKANVIYNTISLYLNALKAEQNVIHQEAVVKNCGVSLDIARQQLKQSQITKPDELKVENDYETALYNLEKSRSDYNLALRQLGNQIGLKDVAQVKLVDPDFKIGAINFDIQLLKEQAVQKRLEMKQAEITIKKAEQQLAQAQNQALPDLNFGYTYRKSDSTESLSISYSLLSGDITGDAQKTVGDKNYIQANRDITRIGIPDLNELTLKLVWKLDFGIPQNQIEQMKLLLENARNSGVQTRQNIEWEVDQAAANYDLAVKQAAIAQKAIAYYQKQLEIKKMQLKLGTASQLDVDIAANDLFQARIQAKNAEYDKVLAFKKLQMASGDLYLFGENLKK